MTIHFPFAVHDSRAREALPLRVVALSHDRTALFFDDDQQVWAKRRMVVARDGRSPTGPGLSARLARSNGGLRHVHLIGLPAEEICASTVDFLCDGQIVARLDPHALQTPLVDPMALLAGLDASGARRLLKLLLTTGASIFGRGELGGFGVLVGQLIEGLATPQIGVLAWCPISHLGALLSYRLPNDVSAEGLRDLCILHTGSARRMANFELVEEATDCGRLLHILLRAPVPRGADVIGLSDQPLRLAGPSESEVARPLAAWAAQRPPEVRSKVVAWLERLAAEDSQAAALKDELTCPAGAEPTVKVRHLSHTPTGLLYLLSVSDPNQMIASVRLSSSGQSFDIDCRALDWHPVHGPVACGFAPIVGPLPTACDVTMIWRSGRARLTGRVTPTQFDLSGTGFGGLPARRTSESLALALPAAMAARPVPRLRVEQFGERPNAPKIALVAAAGDAPEYLHALASILLSEPGGRNVEFVATHADGAGSTLIRTTIEALHAVHQLPIRLVSVSAGATPSETLRAALSETRAPAVLAFEAGCLPAGPGWLRPLRRKTSGSRGPTALPLNARAVSEATGPRTGEATSSASFALNGAAIARLLSSRPLLPSVGPDLAATSGLDFGRSCQTVFTAYQEMPGIDSMRAAAERLAAITLGNEAGDRHV